MQKRLSNRLISYMDRLQPHLTVVVLLALLAGCGPEQREEVTERYSTGEKKKVLTYEGQGAEEELIKRQIYARSGELIRVEDVAEEDTLYYGDLNPELVEPEGLKEFLTGGAWSSELVESSIQFTGDSMYMVDTPEEGRVADARIHGIEYLPADVPGGRLLRQIDSEKDTLWIYPMGPDSLLWRAAFFERVNQNVQKTARSYRKEQRRLLNNANQRITLRPRGNQMKFERDEITVPAGKSVELVFENTATSPSMRHNVVLLKEAPSLEIFKEIGQAGVEAGASYEYVPDHSAILAATDVARPGESVSVTFTVPSEPGEYGYVCTYPGHWATGQGTIQVVRE